jgi:hypothetical protein
VKWVLADQDTGEDWIDSCALGPRRFDFAATQCCKSRLLHMGGMSDLVALNIIVHVRRMSGRSRVITLVQPRHENAMEDEIAHPTDA